MSFAPFSLKNTQKYGKIIIGIICGALLCPMGIPSVPYYFLKEDYYGKAK